MECSESILVTDQRYLFVVLFFLLCFEVILVPFNCYFPLESLRINQQ